MRMKKWIPVLLCRPMGRSRDLLCFLLREFCDEGTRCTGASKTVLMPLRCRTEVVIICQPTISTHEKYDRPTMPYLIWVHLTSLRSMLASLHMMPCGMYSKMSVLSIQMLPWEGILSSGSGRGAGRLDPDSSFYVIGQI